MPNWCENKMTISHSDPSLIKRARDAFMNQQLLNEFIPIPHDLRIVAGRVGADDNPDQVLLVSQYTINKAKYGYQNWYDFSVGEWGTKWDVGYNKDWDNKPYDETPTSFTVNFTSAWSPPVNAYDKLFLAGFDIKAYYFEGGVGFCGQFLNGKDTEYTVRNAPLELQEMFSIELDEDEE
jgi:hypothetical protein